jgi:hypothetical protein
MKRVQGEFLVLEEHITYEDFVCVAKQLSWLKQETIEGDREKEAFQEIWKTPDLANIINYVDDPLTLTRFIWIRGADIEKPLFEICRRLPAYEPEELLEKASEAKTINEGVEAVLRLAVAFPHFDPDVLEIFEKFLDATNANLRKATIQAMAYRLWAESIPLLVQVSMADPDEEVKEFARRVLSYVVQRKNTDD